MTCELCQHGQFRDKGDVYPWCVKDKEKLEIMNPEHTCEHDTSINNNEVRRSK